MLISLHKEGFDSLICIDKQINYPEVWVEPVKDTNPLIHGTDCTESLVLACLASKYYAYAADYLLTMIPRAQMGSESIADEAEGRMGH